LYDYCMFRMRRRTFSFICSNLYVGLLKKCSVTHLWQALSVVVRIAVTRSYLAADSLWNTLTLFFNILGGVKYTYVAPTTRCINTCPVSFGMYRKPLPEVVWVIEFKSVSKVFWRAIGQLSDQRKRMKWPGVNRAYIVAFWFKDHNSNKK